LRGDVVHQALLKVGEARVDDPLLEALVVFDELAPDQPAADDRQDGEDGGDLKEEAQDPPPRSGIWQ
jgi:hypothetical protein